MNTFGVACEIGVHRADNDPGMLVYYSVERMKCLRL